MPDTYKAVVHGNQIQWLGDAPEIEPPLEIDVTVRNRRAPMESGRAMADALEELAKIAVFKNMKDPVAWQREIRQDRPPLGC